MSSYKDFKRQALRDPKIKKAYDDLEPEFAIIRLMIRKRIEQGVTQKDLAKKIGTKQSAISRFESGLYNPTISFLQKIAHALDAQLTITLTR